MISIFKQFVSERNLPL